MLLNAISCPPLLSGPLVINFPARDPLLALSVGDWYH
jgi:hypothetical protein